MSKKYTFRQFLTEEIYIGKEQITDEDSVDKYGILDKIEIPMIQRDYAQGREIIDKKKEKVLNETGKRFINSIFSSLNEKKEMELEFIYGSVEERNKEHGSREKINVYIPLDGQQRLTTLYLLYWYIGFREITNTESLKSHLNMLGKFTYLTRSSSRIFCNCICNYEKMKDLSFAEKKPSEIIENRPWFYKEYKKDPTVRSMLNMLNYIALKYDQDKNEESEYLPLLENLSFYPFSLDKFNLTEDLYIKMNARGKQLSDFENFKADLINWMRSTDNPEIEKFTHETSYKGRKMKYYMSIAQKMDNEWNDIFWSVTKDFDPSSKNGKLTDPLFMRFFIRLLHFTRIFQLQSEGLTNPEIKSDSIVDYFYGDDGNDTDMSYSNNDFESYYKCCLSYQVIKYIETFLDKLQSKIDLINQELVPAWSKFEKWSFYYPKINRQQRAAFIAVFKYIILNSDFNDDKFKDWMRVVWNIQGDPLVVNITDSIGMFNFIDKISENSSDILSWLSTDPDVPRSKDQIIEESIKAKLILKDSSWDSIIRKAEAHQIFKGRIQFLFPEAENTEQDVFKKLYNASEEVFKYADSSKKDVVKGYQWIRATLSTLDTFDLRDFKDSTVSFTNLHEAWRGTINTTLIEPIRSLLFKVSDNMGNAQKYIQSLCENYQEKQGLEWLYPIITWTSNDNKCLFNYADRKKIVMDKEGYIWLYKNIDPSSGNILLSGFRNKIVSQIIKDKNKFNGKFDWDIQSYECNIEQDFFKGEIVTPYREIKIKESESYLACYEFGKKNVIVGFRYKDNKDNLLNSINSDNEIWIMSKEYNFENEVTNNSDISIFIDKIENEVFDINNPDSLINNLKYKIDELEESSIETEQ